MRHLTINASKNWTCHKTVTSIRTSNINVPKIDGLIPKYMYNEIVPMNTRIAGKTDKS